MSETEQTKSAGLQRVGQSANAPDNGIASPGKRALEVLGEVGQKIASLPPGKRNGLIASVFFLGAMCGGLVWYAGRTEWRVLFNGLEGKDMQQVSQELSAAAIPFRLTEDGSGIEVPAAMIDKARMEVAAKGMPQTGRLGFELFDKPNWMGSEFDERVNYQRALEGELEHTIETLGIVRSVRVHLVMPERSLFSTEDRAAKASVVLKLKRTALDREQADSIRSVVAGAVENLSIENVALIDADGRANLKPRSEDAAEADLEQQMESKLVAMLEPLAGRDNVRATVNVNYDESRQERTDEVYDPNQTAPLTLERSEQVTGQSVRAGGIPGTASNSPAGAGVGSVQGSQAAASPGTPPLLQKETLPVYPQQGGAGGQSARQESETYGVTKHVLHTEERPGRVRRISAAVVVNDRSVREGAGKSEHVVWRPRSADEMRRLEQLAQAAVGFDNRRGDEVVVENVSFESNAPEMKTPFTERVADEIRNLVHSQPELGRAAAVAVCGVLVVLFVMRPIARQVTSTLNQTHVPALAAGNESRLPPALALASEEARLEDTYERSKIAPTPAVAMAALQRQGVYEQVVEHIRREPVQSTRLLEAWIGSIEEGD